MPSTDADATVSFQLHLDSETVGSLETGQPLTVPAGTAFRDVIARMQELKSGSLLVVRDELLTGIVTERDVLRVIATGGDLDAAIDEYMTAEPVTIEAGETVGRAIQNMAQGRYRRLPIVDQEGATVGIVKVSHILRYLVEHFPRAVYTLPPSPNPTTHKREGA